MFFILDNSFFILKFEIKHANENKNLEKENIFNLDRYSNNTSLFERINDFITLCKSNILINPISYNYDSPPKITAIIPVFNASETIKYAVRSIQNQNMKEIEILLVDDHSSDNSLEVINDLIIEDKRIKLIKNKQNKGILYSRSIGALKAKGKYIMALDNDDLFIFGIFNKCYDEAEKNNLDIIEFSGIQICQNCKIDPKNIYIPYYLRFKKDGLIVNQPELSKFIYLKNNTSYSYDFIDVFVWGKLIKTKIYRKAIKLIRKFIFNYNIYLTEDKILTVALFRVANSFKYIDIYGIIYIENQYSICHSWIRKKKKRILIDFLLFAVFFFNLNKDKEEIQIVIEDLKIRFEEYNNILDGYYKLLFIKLYNNILKCKTVTESDKKIIKNLINNNDK